MNTEATAGEPEGIRAVAVGDWIGGLGVGARPPFTFARIGAGLSNLTFLVEDGAGSSWVLRRPPLGRLARSAHDIEREYRILAGLEATAVPTPRVHGLCSDPSVSEVPLLLMEHVEGLVIEDLETAAALQEAHLRTIGEALPAGLAALHKVDPVTVGLGWLSRSSTPLAERQLNRWLGQWEASRTRELRPVEELAERLRAAMPPQSETRIVHGDFHILNLIFSSRGEVRAILDWELCTLGDPLADLGALLAYLPDDGGSVGPLIPFGGLPGFPSKAEIVAAYEERSGRSVDALGFWHSLALWKIAIIVEGVRLRQTRQPANRGRAARPVVADVDTLLHRALVVAGESGI